jgi:uncharacterized membrane protein (UPF0127 family)
VDNAFLLVRKPYPGTDEVSDVNRSRVWYLVVVVAAVVSVTLAVQAGVLPFPGGETYEDGTVRVYDADGSLVTSVDVEVADTDEEREQGLSGTESLANGSGMLFVHDRQGTYTYIMPDMNYPLDMIFVGADKQVTAIRHAPAPRPNESGADIRRTGTGKWVLEVPRGYANATGISVGDRVEIEYGNTTG